MTDLQGSCLCGAVAFRYEGPIHSLQACHCERCRKCYGSAFGPIAIIDREGFAFTRGEESIAALCRREGLNPNLYYRWSKEFLEAGKKRLLGDTTREATSTEVADVRKDVAALKQVVAELVLENRLLKKSVTGFDSEAGT